MTRIFKEKIYRFLPIVFGCHCRADRSFYFKGEKFPICARCTGELIGMLMAIIISFFYIPKLRMCFIIAVPMIADGFLQLLTKYESTNTRRLVTGILFGYALVSFFEITTVMSFEFGKSLSYLLR